MNVIVDLKFKAKDVLVPDRIHHLYFPAILETSDGCLETKNLQLESLEICGLTVDCSEEGMASKPINATEG